MSKAKKVLPTVYNACVCVREYMCACMYTKEGHCSRKCPMGRQDSLQSEPNALHIVAEVFQSRFS